LRMDFMRPAAAARQCLAVFVSDPCPAAWYDHALLSGRFVAPASFTSEYHEEKAT
jgi:hypothetical protein